MFRSTKLSIAALGIIALAGCTKTTPAASDSTVVASTATTDSGADEQAVKAINPAWFKAHEAGDVEGIVALYSEDAVLSVPGVAPIRGTAGIREAYAKDIRDMKAAGLSETAGTNPEIGVSGDLGHEWNTFTVKDKSGKTVDTGKYVTVFARRNGKWLIIRDIWNSDTPATPAT